MTKVRAVFLPCKPDQAPYITEVDDDLEAMKDMVGGWIEEITTELLLQNVPIETPGRMPVILMDEEGYMRGRPPNGRASVLVGTMLVGDCLLLATTTDRFEDEDGEQFVSLEPEELDALQQFGLDLDAAV